MISFRLLDESVKEDILSELRQIDPEADLEYAEEILSLHIENGSEWQIEYAACHCLGCLLIRCYDGEYSFSYPIPLSESADPLSAAMEIRAYAVKEDVPLVFYDVPKEDMGALVTGFRHFNIDAEDRDGDSYRVKVMSEAALIDEIPTIEIEEVTLDAFTPEDDKKYSLLCRDKESNRFWGYDYSLDMPDPEDSYFREENEAEFDRGVLISFAVRVDGHFAGEALLCAFDLFGGCEVAVRLLPEYRRGGYATKALQGLREVAEAIGVTRLYSTVFSANEASVRMCERFFDSAENMGEKIKFYTDI